MLNQSTFKIISKLLSFQYSKIKENKSTKPRLKKTTEQIKLLLLEAVGEIIRNSGYSSLSETEIARQSGLGQHLIGEYFGTAEELVEEYFINQDYWIEYENGIMELKEANCDNLHDMVKAIFEYHYRFYDKHKEMQKLIVLELNKEAVPLMKDVFRARRELETTCFELTDEYFRDSSLDFRIVGGVLMYWLDLLVLHPEFRSEGSFDLLTREGREQIVQSILFIIGSIFKTVEEEKIKKCKLPYP